MKRLHIFFLVFISLCGLETAQAQTTFSNSAPIKIAAFGPATPYSSNITVSGLPPTAGKITVTLNNVNHTFSADIGVLLVGPNGVKVRLMSDDGGETFLTNTNITFDDDAQSFIPAQTQIFSGTYKPTQGTTPGLGDLHAANFSSSAPAGPYESTLSSFKNINPNGTWSLYVDDDTDGDAGSINNGWSITITPLAPTAASVGVSGRVTDSRRRSISGAIVQLTNQNGETQTTRTNSFGYYTFKEVAAGGTYIFNVYSKRYHFTPQSISLTGDMDGLNFVAQ